MKLHDAISSTVSAVDPANVSWLDVARLTDILQALGTLVSDDDTAGGQAATPVTLCIVRGASACQLFIDTNGLPCSANE